MITLTNGNVQNPAALAVPNGSVTFNLNVDATVIAAPYGFVSAAEPVVFQFDSTGNIQSGAQIYSNKELQPQNSLGLGTYYLVTFYDANGARINKNPMWWQFSQASGSTVDIGTVIPISTIGNNVIFYPTSFLATPGGSTTDIQVNISGALYGDDGFTYDPVTQAVGGQSGVLISPTPNLAITLSAITQSGVAGIVPYTYAVIAVKGDLNIVASTPQTIATGNLALGVSNFNTLAWTAVPGAQSYTIHRWVPIWVPSTVYALNTVIVDSTGHLQQVTTGGTSGNFAPAWNTSLGGTTADGVGTLVWTNRGVVTAPTAGVIVTGITALTFNDTGFAASPLISLYNDPLALAEVPFIFPYVRVESGWVGIETGLAVTGGGWNGGVFTSASHFGDPVELVDFTTVIYGGSTQSRFEFYDIGTTRSNNTQGVSAVSIYAQDGAFAGLCVSNNAKNTPGATQVVGIYVGANMNGITTTHATEAIFAGCYIKGCTITGPDDAGEFGFVCGYRAEVECENSAILTLMGGQVVTDVQNSTVTDQLGYRVIHRSEDAVGQSSVVTNQIGFRAETFVNGSGTPTISNAYGFYAQKMFASGFGMGFTAAFYAADQGTAAGSWAVYTAGSTPSQFGGVVTMPTLIESATHTPSSASDTGTTGQIAWDASFIYIAVGTNTWKRAAIASW